MFHTYKKPLARILKLKLTDREMSSCYNNKGKLDGLVAVYVDYTLAEGLKTFEKLTDMIQLNSNRSKKDIHLSFLQELISFLYRTASFSINPTTYLKSKYSNRAKHSMDLGSHSIHLHGYHIQDRKSSQGTHIIASDEGNK